MAIQTIVPYTVASDMLSIEEIKDQLKDTGHPVTTGDIKRWIREQDLYTEKYRRDVYVSYSDILMAHQEHVVSQN
ncbi:hypothetical protein [Streptomyces sp. BE133]|uniref:hypothetical protein n=1 Tax=Streptomyces sp. BE133 TaxID=3002523 RepID=UPI002E79FA4B|nr:hypothetical protein [Streptomyces sp. BE133]MEE1812666.1 hypothetical protein [Streptomyces sp. BE133]